MDFEDNDLQKHFLQCTKVVIDRYSYLARESQGARLNSDVSNVLGLDPFSLSILCHRQVQKFDENSYSDWLCWIIRVLGEQGFSAIDLCFELFGGPREHADYFEEKPSIARELPLEYGHAGQTGRADIVIIFNKNKIVFHVEVKTVSAEEGDLAKNDGYARSLYEKFEHYELYNILLVTGAACRCYITECCLAEFFSVTWTEISKRLRLVAISPRVLPVTSGIVTFFCAVIEQCLMRMGTDSLAQLDYIKSIKGESVDYASKYFEEMGGLYAEATLAAYNFELILNDTIGDVFTEELKNNICRAIGADKLSDGSIYLKEPDLGARRSMNINTFWKMNMRSYNIYCINTILYVGFVNDKKTILPTVILLSRGEFTKIIYGLAQKNFDLVSVEGGECKIYSHPIAGYNLNAHKASLQDLIERLVPLFCSIRTAIDVKSLSINNIALAHKF